jgi:hypothetical protein
VRAALGGDDASIWLGISLHVRCADAKRCDSRLYQCRGPRMRNVAMWRAWVLSDVAAHMSCVGVHGANLAGSPTACTHTPRFSTQQRGLPFAGKRSQLQSTPTCKNAR